MWFFGVRGEGFVSASQNRISQMDPDNQAIFEELSCIYVKSPELYLL